MNWLIEKLKPLPTADPDPFAMMIGEWVQAIVILALIVDFFVQRRIVQWYRERLLAFDYTERRLQRENETLKQTLKNIGWGDEDGALDLSGVKSKREVAPRRIIR